LNDASIRDSYPLPNLTETLDRLHKAKYFTSLDMVSGYHQIQVAEEDRPKTAFASPYGLYQFCRMPFGLNNAPGTFQRVVNDLIQVLATEDVLAYLDDFICFHDNWSDHVAGIDRVLRLFKASGFKLSGKKCQFAQEEVAFLGHIVSSGSIRPMPQKLSIIQGWQTPQDSAELARFLGLIGFYRKFIPSYAKISAPLYEQLKDFQWSSECTSAFVKLKQVLLDDVVLRLPDPKRHFTVTCDASSIAVGYVLEQTDDNGSPRPVAFGGRKLNRREAKYSATELECLAVVEAVKTYRPYLLGAHFILYTDHEAVKWLLIKKNAEGTAGRLWRWAHKLDEYDFTVRHKPGKTNAVADALSRSVQHVSAVCLNNEFSLAEIREEQDKDPELRNLRSELTKRKPSVGAFAQILPRVSVDPVSGLLTVDRSKIMLPPTLQRTALKGMHDIPAAGHQAAEKTLSSLQERFFWIKMRRDVEEWVSTCVTCQERRPPPSKPKAPHGKMPTPTKPFEFLQIDLKGKLPETATGNEYLMVVYDYFSKYIVAVPLPNKRTETVTEAFVKHFVLTYGVPSSLCSDQGSEFESRLLQDTCRQLHIEKVRTSVAHPSSNGGVERCNRTIGDLLRLLVRDDQRDWDVWVPYVCFAYNTSVHSSTQSSPFELVFGLRRPRVPCDVMLATLPRPGSDELPSLDVEGQGPYRKRLARAFESVTDRLKRRQDRLSCDHDRTANFIPFQEGEKV